MVFMLEEYPHVRCSAADALDHPWVSVSARARSLTCFCRNPTLC